MTKKLIALDLDGTTLNNESKITAKTIAALHQAAAQGHMVAIATGRPNRISENYYHQLGLQGPMVNFNGGLIHIPEHSWAGEYSSAIPRDLVFDVLKLKQDLPIEMIAAEGKNFVYADRVSNLDIGFFPKALSPDQVLNERNLRADPTSLTIFVDNKDQEFIRETLYAKYPNIEMNSWGGAINALEIVEKGINKYRGVQYLADYFEIDNKDIIAFGDEVNDLEMLTHVGWGVAMANGVPEVKAVANDVTTLPNNEDGLADYLTKYLAV
ncbi:Cof-type HAD-IIB family hydrolase [Lapidilactobacillus luobeiensis]|uniref:Cof-type HAD-IIB family hydrolase n=1 Tax=Lapidilactobacillus luobeiensis TaxID=2950371 RepID=UPI0021C37CEA|nr:Cof-type HAD-IIB family hydrolase [Lapidilactobacillus luobeiensis]